MSGKRRHQQQQYGARRMTKAYQLNMMVEEREKEKKAQESAKRQKYLSIGGTISFVGLVIPHMARILVGPNHRRLLPASLFF